MWIYLLRHGIAEDAQPGWSDEQRQLTDEGRQRLQRAARTWSRMLDTPDVVISSPLVRARQTSDVFCEALDFVDDVRVDAALVPHARPEKALVLLEAELLAGTESVALVGHEPNMGYLLGSLLTGDDRTAIAMKKGMLVGLRVRSTTNVICELRFTLGQKLAGRLS